MKREMIETTLAPAGIGVYSQAVKVGDLVFISGQIPLDPKTQQVVEGSFEQSVRQVFHNLKMICEAAGGGLHDIVKLNVYLADLSTCSILNEIMAEYFQKPYPARAVVEVSRLPKDVMVEVDAVMVIQRGEEKS